MPVSTISRAETHPSFRILLLDNYDSFTYNLCDYLITAGADCLVLRNDACPLEEIHTLAFDAIVLSPGPGRPADAGIMPELIQYYHDKKPILGICLGHQAIGEFFGANLVFASLPMHGKTSKVYHQQQHPLFGGLPDTFEVMRYHSLLLQDIEDTPLRCIAKTASGEIMAIAHPELPLTGVQFHPESIMTPNGRQILRNWISSCSSYIFV